VLFVILLWSLLYVRPSVLYDLQVKNGIEAFSF
jgi:hypothetical protein